MRVFEGLRLTKSFGGIHALENVSIHAQKGEIIAIIGPNGAGKTTLFNCISGFYPLSSGEIFISGKKNYIVSPRYFLNLILSLFVGLFSVILLNAQTLFQSVIIDRYVYLESFPWGETPGVLIQSLLDLSPLTISLCFFIPAIIFFISSYNIQKQGSVSPLTFSSVGITRTFQNIRLFKSFTSFKNVLVGLDHTLTYSLFGALFRTNKMRHEELVATENALSLLKRVNVNAPEKRASSLSYGNQRRVEIARALACNPMLLLLDEPAAGMNEAEAESLRMLIESFKHDGITVMLIEHHMAFVMGISDRIYVLNFGKPLAEGTPKEIQENPHVIKSYLGEDDE